MLLAILVVTGETTHRTATATYLVNPHVQRVLVAKLIAMMSVAGVFWATTTVIDTITNAIYIRSEGFNVAGSDPVIVRAVLLNLLAYVMWAAPVDAAVRETLEETGLTVGVIKRLGERVHPSTGRAMVYVACEVLAGTAHVADDEEVAEVKWCDRIRLARLVPRQLHAPVQDYLDLAVT